MPQGGNVEDVDGSQLPPGAGQGGRGYLLRGGQV